MAFSDCAPDPMPRRFIAVDKDHTRWLSFINNMQQVFTARVRAETEIFNPAFYRYCFRKVSQS
jgi:hypothetical protein